MNERRSEAKAAEGGVLLVVGADALKPGNLVSFCVFSLVAGWIHFTLFGIVSLTIKLNVHTFWGAYELSN